MSTDKSTDRVVAEVHDRLVAAGLPDGDLRPEVARLAAEIDPLLEPAGVEAVARGVLAVVAGLGPLAPLLDDPAITEVMVNGPHEVWVERSGALHREPVELGQEQIEHLIERVVGPLGLRADRSAPIVDARLPDGSRVNVVLPPLAIDGPCVTIRRFGARAIRLAEMCSRSVEQLLRDAVQRRLNVVVSGATGAGKTTLLNALAAELPPSERVITVEDAAELRLPGDHVVRLECRPASADGVGAVEVRHLVRNALRMRPDRLVVGEVRGGEAFDMVQALNTGHDGSMSTCHANSPDDALARIESMVLLAGVGLPLEAVRHQVSAALDLVVHVERAVGGARRVAAVGEVAPWTGAGPLRARIVAAEAS